MIMRQIARILANIILFLDLSDDDTLDIDEACQMGEFLGAELKNLDKGFLRELVDAFDAIAPEYSGEAQVLVRRFASDYFLEDAIAADDPVRLAELEAIRDARED